MTSYRPPVSIPRARRWILPVGHAKSHTYPLVAFSLGSGFGSHFYGSFLAECADGIGVPGSLRLYSDRCADERSEPFFAREFLLEKAFLARRAGHASKSPRPTGSAGAFAVFPVVLFGEFENHSGCGAAGQRALQVSAEPGSFFAVGKHRVDWSLDLSQGQLRGHFTVTVSDKSAGQGDASCELVAPDGTTTQYSPPLPPLVLPPLSPGRVNEAAGRLEVEAERARTDILRFSERLLRQVVTRLARQFTSQVDADDAHQLAAIECLRLAERFASPERPAVSWSRYVVLNANRAVARALERDGHFRRPERAVERLLEEHPELVGAPVEVVRAEAPPSSRTKRRVGATGASPKLWRGHRARSRSTTSDMTRAASRSYAIPPATSRSTSSLGLSSTKRQRESPGRSSRRKRCWTTPKPKDAARRRCNGRDTRSSAGSPRQSV